MSAPRRPHVQAALTVLRAAADATRRWPDTTWRRIAGPAPPTVVLRRGEFENAVLGRGTQTVLEWNAHIPASIGDVPVVGHPLEVTVESLHPLEVHHGDTRVLDARNVAPGPALVTVIPALVAGDNGRVRLTVHAPLHELGWQWLRLGFTTPSLRHRFELLDTTWARLALAEEVAGTPDAHACVDAAVGALHGTDAGDPPAEALDELVQDALAPLAAEIASLRVHLVGHSHIDMNWQWTWSDTTEVILRDLASAVSILDDHPQVRFTHSQPATYEVVRAADPPLFARIVEHIRAGRWEPATMQWVEADTNMASGESTVRQLLEAVRWSRHTLGVSPTVHLAPDTFGHAGNLPQLTSAAGTTIYYHHRCNPGGADGWPAYWWEGDDGTRVLACSTDSYNGELTAGTIAMSAVHAHAHGLPVALHFHGVGNHGGGPARHGIETAERLQQATGLPELCFSTLAAYRDDLLAVAAQLPVHRGESATLFEGCYTTHADVKAYNRRGENLLATAEALQVLAGADRPAIGESGWRPLLFHQFHDILDGSAIHASYEETAEDAHVVEVVASRTAAQALAVLSAGAAVDAVVVVNPTGDPRTDVVTAPLGDGEVPRWVVAPDGSRTAAQSAVGHVVFAAQVPGFGRTVYRLVGGNGDAPPMDVRLASSPTESTRRALGAQPFPGAGTQPYLRVVTDDLDVYVRRNAGIITSLVDRRTNRQLVAYGMRRSTDYTDAARSDLGINVLQLTDEHPHEMSSWHLDEVWRESSLLRGATTEVVDHGPVRTVLETVHRVRDSTITQRMTLYAATPRIDVDLEIDWREVGDGERGVPGLKVAATIADADQAWFETPYAAVRRSANGQEVPALRWAAVSSSSAGIALLNDSKHGYDALGPRLRMTLLRSAYDPDPVSDAGHHTVRYSIVPFAGSPLDAGITALAAAWNQPLVVCRGRGGDAVDGLGWRPRLAPSSARIGALKVAHDGSGDVIVRVAESAGRACSAMLCGLPGDADVREVSIIEDDIGAVGNDGGTVGLELRPWQVRTVRVRGAVS